MLRSEQSPAGSSSPNPPVFSTGARWATSAAGVVLGVVIVVLCGAGPGGTTPEQTDRYVLAHAVAAAPFLLVGLGCSGQAIRLGPAEYDPFWRRWFAASVLGALATASALVSVATQRQAFLLLDMAFLVAAVPLWISATIHMARAQAGRRGVSVDLVDAITALVVLGTPGVLLVAEPLGRTEKLGFAIPFALAAVCAPAFFYLAALSLTRIPAGERAGHAIGLALAAVSSINVTMQLARVLGGLVLPLRVFVGVHTLNMALFMATPLWSHRRAVGQLAGLPPHRQVRSTNPMPYVGAVALPLMGIYVFVTRDERPWGVWFFVAVVLTVVGLNAIRYTAMSRETRRLYAGISHMAEERRQLLARMLRGLEDDRHRTATELHSQTVGSLATLGTLVQMAHAALPGDSAQTVQATIAPLQDDLSARAEHLRQLMLAIRPTVEHERDLPAALARAGHDALAAALLAYASDLWSEDAGPAVQVQVDPVLHLDWATLAIVYRIAQEALDNTAHHADAATVNVAVTEEQGAVVVEVHDDGVGFEPPPPAAGSGLATMQLFAQLGGGELTLRSTPGQGTVVRGRIGAGVTGTVPAGTGSPGRGRGRARKHLHLIGTPDE